MSYNVYDVYDLGDSDIQPSNKTKPCGVFV